MKLTKCYSRKTDALKQTQVPRCSWLPANSGQEHLPLRAKWVCKGGYSSSLGTLKTLSFDRIRSSARWPNLRQVLKGLKGGSCQRRWPVSCSWLSQPHLLSHLTKQSLHIQGCRNRDRETSWLRPNATPYQAVGPSAQKWPHKNGKCPPHLQVQRALQRLGLTRAARRELIITNVLTFPSRIKMQIVS